MVRTRSVFRAATATIVFLRTKGWKTLGAIFTLSVAIAGIYSGFFYERKANLKFEIVSNSHVLDVREEVGKLEIFYNGKSLQSSGLTLSIITMIIENDGNASILLSHFDKEDPVGFSITKGAIIQDVEIIDASNDYLKDKLQLNVSDNTVTFSDFIFDSSDFFTCKVLVLHNKNLETTVNPFGEIATIKKFEVSSYESSKKTFWEKPIGIVFKWVGLAIIIAIAFFILLFLIEALSEVIKSIFATLITALYKERVKRALLPIEYVLLNLLNSKSEASIYLLCEAVDKNDFETFKKRYPEYFDVLKNTRLLQIEGGTSKLSEVDAKTVSNFKSFVESIKKEIDEGLDKVHHNFF